MKKRISGYTLGQKMGKGAFGVVYEGKNIQTNEKVAIKSIKRSGITPLQNKQLSREIDCQRTVSSPHIIRLLDTKKTKTHYYLILEICKGKDLEDFIGVRGQQNESTVQRWIRQLVDGLSELQEKEVIHRDLKPSNIFLSERSATADLKIGDFGASKAADSMQGSVVGTPLYMAPEILAGNSHNSKADIWSLGLVIYYMLTGKDLFKSLSMLDLMIEQRMPVLFPNFFSENCRDLLQQMISYSPRDRISCSDILKHPFLNERISDEDFELLSHSDEEILTPRQDYHIDDTPFLIAMVSQYTHDSWGKYILMLKACDLISQETEHSEILEDFTEKASELERNIDKTDLQNWKHCENKQEIVNELILKYIHEEFENIRRKSVIKLVKYLEENGCSAVLQKARLLLENFSN